MAPRATVRLQCHAGFTLDDAAGTVDYYAALGVSHFYTSPITTARPGSMHGYDVVDHTMVNPELGGEAALRRLVSKLRAHGMGLVIDTVPNHMGVGADNRWWNDVLRNGIDSAYAEYFDIDWHSPDPALRGKVLAPFLGRPYGEALDAGELQIAPGDGEFVVCYFDHRWPIRGDDQAALDESINAPEQRGRLHALLERQHYRLAYWRTAADEINWRRFFDVTSLVALRVEQPQVFDDVHRLVFDLYAQGLIDGVRVDHVDGLADPRGYCRQLRQRLDALTAQRPADAPRASPWIVIEKILAADEVLPHEADDGWQVDGTTGYDFMSEVGAVLHDPRGEAALTDCWRRLTGRTGVFDEEVQQARRQILLGHFNGERRALARVLHQLARADRRTRDLTEAAIERCLIELLVAFAVYRTYVDRVAIAPADLARLDAAALNAQRYVRVEDRPVLEWLVACLKQPPADDADHALATRRFQQLTPPLAAKSIEDTAFYRYGRLLSRNEVGADPGQFALSAEQFFARVQARHKHFPAALLATATHDHKRGEDVRARLAVLSEQPQWWIDTIDACLQASGPATEDQSIACQMIVGAWPFDLTRDDDAGLRAYAERLSAWFNKALREAKLHTSWTAPDAASEARCEQWLKNIMSSHDQPFIAARQHLHALAERLAPAGVINSLAQTTLRLTLPGIPDLYQGTERWDFSLVDPDNRRPVDYPLRQRFTEQAASTQSLRDEWRSGAVKQWLIQRLLNWRKDYGEWLARADCQPLVVKGRHARSVLALMRADGDRRVIIIVTRFATALLDETARSPSIAAASWHDTAVECQVSGQWRDVLTGRLTEQRDGLIRMSQLMLDWPVAVLTAESIAATDRER